MKKRFISSLKPCHLENSTLLLGVSGGPDSMALLTLFLEVKDLFSLNLHVVHFDHAYRKESAAEALGLEKYCKERGIPFFMKRLQKEIPQGNIEEFLRNERYSYFEEVYHTVGANALALGHHRDDLVETTLKRWFEGSNFINAHGLKKEVTYQSMRVLRPLLSFSKKELISYITDSAVPYYIDSSNEDPRFLRGRFRTDLVPYLEETFGKGIQKNIVRLSNFAENFDRYLSAITHPVIETKRPLLGGYYWDLSSNPFTDRLEITHFVSKIAFDLKIHPPHEKIETITDLLIEGAGDKEVHLTGFTWYLEKKVLFVVPSTHFEFSSVIGPFTPQYWESMLEKKYIFSCPSEEYQLSIVPLSTLTIEGKSLADHYNQAKVPPFLRRKVPCFVKGSKVYHELLTGKMLKNKEIW